MQLSAFLWVTQIKERRGKQAIAFLPVTWLTIC